ncbi:hypothetical protein ACFXTH_010096 [Malus domestica]
MVWTQFPPTLRGTKFKQCTWNHDFKGLSGGEIETEKSHVEVLVCRHYDCTCLHEGAPPLLKTYGGTSKAVNGILMVGPTLIEGAAAKGAVCLDGTVPAYHLHRGYGSGANSWLIRLDAVHEEQIYLRL